MARFNVSNNLSEEGHSLLRLQNPVFCNYLFWASVLILKMLMMSLLTAAKRISGKTFANPEDLRLPKVTELKFNNPNVERVRRAHRNDLENVVPYLLIGLLFISTAPNTLWACILFRVAAIARIFHTLVYAFGPVPQPTRTIAFFTTFGITVYMAICVMVRVIVYI